jgi:hypothetical protein
VAYYLKWRDVPANHFALRAWRPASAAAIACKYHMEVCNGAHRNKDPPNWLRGNGCGSLALP